MAVKNEKQIISVAVRLSDRLILINNRDARLRVSETIYSFPNFSSSIFEMINRILQFRVSKNQADAVKLLEQTRTYLSIVNDIFRSSRPKFLTTMRQTGGASFVNAYKDAVLLEQFLSASVAVDDFTPRNLPEQKPSPIYAKVEGEKIVLDSGRALRPLLSADSLKQTRIYLKSEVLQLISSLESSNVDRRLTFEISKLCRLMEFEDDSGAIILGLHTRKVIHMASQIEREVSAVLATQVSSTLTQLSHFASQYRDWVDFLRNAERYPARLDVEETIDSSVENFIAVLVEHPSNVDEEIPATVQLIENSLNAEGENRVGAIYAAVRGFENVCVVTVKFAFDQVVTLLKETAEKTRSYSARILAAAVVTLALGMIDSFMPVIKQAPELHWILENLPKIEKLKDLIK